MTEGVGGRGFRNGDPPRALTLRQIVQAMNHAAVTPRVLFSMAIPASNSPSANGITELFRYRYYQRNNNGKRLVHLVCDLFKDSAGALANDNAVLRDSASDLITHRTMQDNPAEWASARNVSGALTIAPGGAESSRVINVVNGFRLLSAVVYEVPAQDWPIELSGTDHHVDPGEFVTTVPITSSRLASVRTTQQDMWERQRDVYNYCSHGTTAADGWTATTTTFTNLIDGTTARTASTGGIPISALSGALGLGTSVNAHCAVYAERTGGAGSTGEVRFTSSLNSVDIAGIGGANWYPSASNTLQIDTRAVNGDGRDWEKVDVLGRISAADGATLRVWAWHVEIEP